MRRRQRQGRPAGAGPGSGRGRWEATGGDVPRGATRGQHADERLREPYFHVLREERQRIGIT